MSRETGVSPIRLGREDGVPVVPGAREVIRGTVESRTRVGDHSIVLVRVGSITREEEDAGTEPLLWYCGDYAYLERPRS